MRIKDETEVEYKRRRAKALLRCCYCPPHRNENQDRRNAHPVRQPRYKNHRQFQGLKCERGAT